MIRSMTTYACVVSFIKSRRQKFTRKNSKTGYAIIYGYNASYEDILNDVKIPKLCDSFSGGSIEGGGGTAAPLF